MTEPRDAAAAAAEAITRRGRLPAERVVRFVLLPARPWQLQQLLRKMALRGGDFVNH
jgi:hypothetical protein